MNDTGRRPQVVIVCGGRGTRLAPSIGDLPKILTPLDDRSLLAHLLDDLATLGDAEVLLLAGHGGEQVAAEADRLAPPGLEVTTHVETRPRGTAGALLEVEDRLHERFLFACGDVVTSLDWRRLWQAADRRGGLATLLVHRSSHP
ncbi:MAG: NTP transferase domain-containing protein, partial [Acidobacteriota bacterium]